MLVYGFLFRGQCLDSSLYALPSYEKLPFSSSYSSYLNVCFPIFPFQGTVMHSLVRFNPFSLSVIPSACTCSYAEQVLEGIPATTPEPPPPTEGKQNPNLPHSVCFASACSVWLFLLPRNVSGCYVSLKNNYCNCEGSHRDRKTQL